MLVKFLSSAWNLAKLSSKKILREAHLVWQFIKGDFPNTTIPPLLFIVAAWNSRSLSFNELLIDLGCGLIYFTLYPLAFCLSNQIIGIEEDRINKPHRPIVTGAVSYRGAQVRWVASMILFSLVGWLFGVWQWATLWQVCILLHNFGGFAKHWLTKNLIMGVGILVQLAAAWQIVTPITPLAWRWIFVLSVLIILVVAVQDLRDMEGDRAIGRNTFPIAFGETTSRIILCAGFILIPLAIHFGLMLPQGQTLSVMLSDMGIALFSLAIAARIILYRSPQADNHTYLLFSYWYCAVLGSAIAIV